MIGHRKSSRRTATPEERTEAARETLLSLAAVHRDIGNGELARQLLETAAALSGAGPGRRSPEHATRAVPGGQEARLWRRHAPTFTTMQDEPTAGGDADSQEKRR